MKITVNETNSSSRRCAFCKFWYDPQNTAIEPMKTGHLWKYDPDKKNKCRKKNLQTVAHQSCMKFESKI